MSRIQISILIALGLLGALAGVVSERHTSTGTLTVSWTDNTNGRAHTKIERRTRGAADFVTIASVGPRVTTYVDSPLRRGTTYCYRVRAFDPATDAVSPHSETVCATAR